MKHTDHVMTRNAWFNAHITDCLAHKVAQELINRASKGDAAYFEKLLWIVRRYE